MSLPRNQTKIRHKGVTASDSLALVPIAGQVTPIAYTLYSASESGSVGSTDFTDVPINFVGIGDTADA